jgi:hypothetical protein
LWSELGRFSICDNPWIPETSASQYPPAWN